MENAIRYTYFPRCCFTIIKNKNEMDEDEKLKNSVWLLQYIHKRIEENRNFIAIFTGDTGSGKSYSAIRLAEMVDTTFSHCLP